MIGTRARTLRPSPGLPSRTCRLPNGFNVRYVSKDDVSFIYKEVYEDRVHLRHGLQLRQADVVLDVGANLGIFSAFAAEQVGPQGRVIACEPLPATFAALEANMESHQQWCAENGTLCSPVEAMNVGMGDGTRRTATFTLYEQAAGWGTMYPAEGEVEQDMGVFLQNALDSSQPSSTPSALSGPARLLGAALLRFAPRGAYEAAWRGAVGRMLGSATQHECQLSTVSDIIADYGLTKVDLLKVDVERAELDVLRGLTPAHWPLISQAVVEVHEVHLEGVLGLLRQQGGFQGVVVEQEPDLKGTSLYMVYCRRE